MSSEEDKIKRSRRFLKDENAVKKQTKIAKQHSFDQSNIEIKQPHRLAKNKAMNCGNSNCLMCSNPRKVWNERTVQEESFDQTANWYED